MYATPGAVKAGEVLAAGLGRSLCYRKLSVAPCGPCTTETDTAPTIQSWNTDFSGQDGIGRARAAPRKHP